MWLFVPWFGNLVVICVSVLQESKPTFFYEYAMLQMQKLLVASLLIIASVEIEGLLLFVEKRHLTLSEVFLDTCVLDLFPSFSSVFLCRDTLGSSALVPY